MCGGGSSPPPAPKTPADFGDEIAQKRAELQAQLNQEALDYNSSVASYNDALSGLKYTYTNSNTVDNPLWNIGDILDNFQNTGDLDIPDISGRTSLTNAINTLSLTTVDDYYNNYSTALSGYQSQLAGLARPEAFAPQLTYNFPEYASATITLDRPNVDSINESLYSLVGSELSGLGSSLDTLYNQRQQAEQDYDSFYDGLIGSSTTALRNAEGLTLEDYFNSGLNQSPLTSLRSSFDNYVSPIHGDYSSSKYDTANANLEALQAIYDGLGVQFDNEEDRIDAYKSFLNTELDTYEDTFANLTYGSSGLDAYNTSIDQLYRNTRDFESPIATDFNEQFNRYSGLNATIEDLIRQRETEQNRIENYGTSLDSQLYDYTNSVNRLGIADGAQLMTQEQLIQNVLNSISGFSSELDYNFDTQRGGFNTLLDQIGSTLDARDAEQARIDAYRNTLGNDLIQAGQEVDLLGIADIDRINALDSEWAARYADARNFNSELAYNFDSELSNYNGLNSRLDTLRSQHDAEQDRIAAYEAALTADASNYGRQVGRLTLADLTQINSLEDVIGARLDQNGAFQSDLAYDFSDEELLYQPILDQLADLRNQNTTEQNRIDQYRTATQNYLSGLINTIDQLGIADIDQINSLDAELAAKLQEANAFTSDLSFNFNDLYQQGLGLDSQLGQLVTERDNELDRIAAAQNNYRNQATDINRLIRDGNMYSGALLNSYGDKISDLRAALGDFTSDLSTDFTDAYGVLDTADAALLDLRGQRDSGLAALLGDLSGLQSGFDTVPLYDETNLNRRTSDLQSLYSDLYAYTGNDLTDEYAQFDDYKDALESRYNDLTDYRADLETQAADYLRDLPDTELLTLDDVTAAQDNDILKTLRNEIDQYKATQATDELDQIEAWLEDEHTRITNENAQRQALLDGAQSSVGDVLTEQEIYSMTGTPLTAEEYFALINGGPTDQDQDTFTSAFLRSLMLA